MASIDVLNCFTHQGNLTGIHSSVTTFPGLVIKNEIQMAKTGECNAAFVHLSNFRGILIFMKYVSWEANSKHTRIYNHGEFVCTFLSFFLRPHPTSYKTLNFQVLVCVWPKTGRNCQLCHQERQCSQFMSGFLPTHTCSFSLSQAPEAYSDN